MQKRKIINTDEKIFPSLQFDFFEFTLKFAFKTRTLIFIFNFLNFKNKLRTPSQALVAERKQ